VRTTRRGGEKRGRGSRKFELYVKTLTFIGGESKRSSIGLFKNLGSGKLKVGRVRILANEVSAGSKIRRRGEGENLPMGSEERETQWSKLHRLRHLKSVSNACTYHKRGENLGGKEIQGGIGRNCKEEPERSASFRSDYQQGKERDNEKRSEKT